MPDTTAQRVLPVLTYHSIDESGSPISISPAEFRRHMQALAGAGWRTLTIGGALDGLASRGWPDRSFLLTFDDGYGSVMDKAAPDVHACGFKPIVFVVSGRVGSDNRWPGQPSFVPPAPLLDWPALRSLVQAGWSLGAHSRTHPRLPTLASDAAIDEIAGSKRDIEDRCGSPVDTFAYPYGAVSAAVRAAAARHYGAAFGTRLACVTPRASRMELDRLDAYYLQGRPFIDRLDGKTAALYFTLRRAARTFARLRR